MSRLNPFDTIVAPITGLPPAAVAWLRVSGPDAWRIGAELFSPWPQSVESHRAVYGRYAHGDDGLALPFAEGHSYTGDESVELSIHGSYASIRSLVEACLRAGARLAEPGEFTERAFLNGRLDLAQAEAVRDTIESLTGEQLRQANRNRDGALSREAGELSGEVRRMLAAVEASVDFSEEVGDFDRVNALGSLSAIRGRIERLHSGARVSRIVRDGYRIAIIGPPNAGKSSLLNRLLGSERSIVTAIPGTTRDFVEERADFGGVPVVLVDTAGIRESEDEVEQIGVQRAWDRAREADAVWYVYDGTLGIPDIEVAKIAESGLRATFLANKADLGISVGNGRPISARTGKGVDVLVDGVREEVLGHAPAIAVNERQSELLRQALEAVDELEQALRYDSPDDLLSVFLQEILSLLGRITGDTADADLLEQIFRDFCVGK